SESALKRVRQKCVESGWLVYEPGAKGRAARYWVQIPERFLSTDDAPTDENPAEFDVKPNGRQVGSRIQATSDTQSERQAASNRAESNLNPGGMNLESGLPSSLPLSQSLFQENTPPPSRGGTSSDKDAKQPPPAKQTAGRSASAESIPVPPKLDTPEFRA